MLSRLLRQKCSSRMVRFLTELGLSPQEFRFPRSREGSAPARRTQRGLIPFFRGKATSRNSIVRSTNDGELEIMKRTICNIVFCLTLIFAFCGYASPQASAISPVRSNTLPSDIKSHTLAQASNDDPIATVAGQLIYEQDLAVELGPKLLELRNQEYQMKRKALDELIRKRLIDGEAQKRGISSDKLLEQEVDSKVADPSDAEVEGYYLAVKNQLDQPFPEIKPQIQKALKVLKTQQARQDYGAALGAKAEISVLLRPPKVEVGYDSARVRGDAKAPVTIVEFSDFQCPYCKKVQPTLKDLLAKYNGWVKLAYRDLPLHTLHPQAQLAAKAGRCAEEQGKFWEYHDALFADQSKLDEASLVKTAKSLGLNEKSFQSCLNGGKFEAQIEQDVLDGTKAGVNGTPGFFINGEFVSGAQPEVEFEKVIERQLATSGSPSSMRATP